MKVVILTAGIGDKKYSLPKCFTTTIGSVALIEYVIRSLRLLNISPKNIFLATSSNIRWGSKKYHDLILSLGVNEILIKQNFKHSFQTFLSCIKNFKSTDVVILNGDNYFKFLELEYLIYSNSKKNLALIQSRNSVVTKEPVLNLSKNKISKIINCTQTMSIPWFAYYGGIFLKKSEINKIKKSKPIDIPYMDYFINILKIKVNIKEVSSISNKGFNNQLRQLTGGSFAGLKKMILVQKKANQFGKDKLVNEIKWLKNLNSKVSKKFPMVLNYGITKNDAWYTMPWYPMDNLRQKIISGVFGLKEINYNIRPILNFLWKNLYKKKINNANLSWVNKKHFERFYTRLSRLKKCYPFNKILKFDKIILNGKEYENLPILVDKIKIFSDKSKIFTPKHLVQIHGDLHFQNILIGDNPEDFMLADPQGDNKGSDIYYDAGKLWHSFNGKYDLIHSDLSDLKIISLKKNSFNINFGPDYLLNIYNSIEELFINIMKDYPISNDKNWLLKTKFSEFMHFSSVMDFHLKFDKKEKKAILMYLSSIILGSKILDQIKDYEKY